MPLKRDVIYPIFLKCLVFAEDMFWKETFEEFSYGNCVHGAYISKGYICSSLKGKEFVYKFADKPETKIYSDITKLLKEKLNIMSKNDKKILIEEFEEVERQLKSLKNLEWCNIKKKSVKDIMFQNYLINMKKVYSLRDSQIKKIYNFINLGIMLKSIKNSDIVYESGEIKEIIGISFVKGKYSLDMDIYSGLDEEVGKPTNKKGQKRLRDL